jgi:hypothetical protein
MDSNIPMETSEINPTMSFLKSTSQLAQRLDRVCLVLGRLSRKCWRMASVRSMELTQPNLKQRVLLPKTLKIQSLHQKEEVLAVEASPTHSRRIRELVRLEKKLSVNSARGQIRASLLTKTSTCISGRTA